MEPIETCINKGPNANPSDVSPNALPNVLTIEAITKVPIFTTTLDVKKENDSQPIEIEARQLCGIGESKGTKNYGGTMFTRGRRSSLLATEGLADLCTRGPLHDQIPWSTEVYQHCHQSCMVDRWSMYLIPYLPPNAGILFGEGWSMNISK